MNNKLLIGIFAGSTLAILLLGLLLTSKTQAPQLQSSDDVSASVLGAKTHNWGNIDIRGGDVEKIFEIKNSGSVDLEMSNIKTSCMCTTAQVIVNGKISPIFGMHTLSSWKGVVKPDQVAQVKVVFDPMAHGPQGTGPVTRSVFIETNDSSNPTIELRVSGVVVD